MLHFDEKAWSVLFIFNIVWGGGGGGGGGQKGQVPPPPPPTNRC